MGRPCKRQWLPGTAIGTEVDKDEGKRASLSHKSVPDPKKLCDTEIPAQEAFVASLLDSEACLTEQSLHNPVHRGIFITDRHLGFHGESAAHLAGQGLDHVIEPWPIPRDIEAIDHVGQVEFPAGFSIA